MSDMDVKELEKAKQDVRLTQLEIDTKIIKTDINNISKNLDVISNNHLEHLKQDISKLDTRVWAILFSIIMLTGSTLLSVWVQ
jgi:predicted  nucleic acid-binding Zn-ribbon protein